MKKRLKKVLATGLSLTLGFSSVPTAFASDSSFSDTSTHWAKEWIEWGVQEGIVTGYTNGTFLPKEAVTRAEFATMVNKAWGLVGEAEISFSDVDEDAWYYNTLEKVAYIKSIAGYEDGTVRPDTPITREEAMTVLARICPLYPASEETLTALFSFDDAASISDWAFSSVARVFGASYITGYPDNTLRPKDNITRGEAIALIARVMEDTSFVREDVSYDEDGTYIFGEVFLGTVTLDKNIADITFENCVFLGPLALYADTEDVLTLTNCTITELSYLDSTSTGTSTSAGGSSGGSSGGGGSTVTTQTLAAPSVMLIKDGDTYYITGETASADAYASNISYEVSYKVIAPVVATIADIGDTDGDTDTDADTDSTITITVTAEHGVYKVLLDDVSTATLLGNENAYCEIAVRAMSADSSSGNIIYSSSSVASVQYSAASMADAGTAVTGVYDVTSESTLVSWTLNNDTLDTDKSFAVYLYQLADDGTFKTIDSTIVEGVYEVQFAGALANGTYKVGVSTLGEVNAIVVLSSGFVIDTVVSDVDALEAPSLALSYDSDSGAVTLAITGNESEEEGLCLGSYEVTIVDEEGEILLTESITLDESDYASTKSLAITDVVESSGAYTISAVLLPSSELPLGHHHNQSEEVSISVLRLGDVEDATFATALDGEENPMLSLSWTAGAEDAEVENFAIVLEEKDTDNGLSFSLTKENLSYDEVTKSYTYDATEDMYSILATLPSAMYGDVRELTAFVKPLGENTETGETSYVLDAVNAVETSTTAKIQIAKEATGLSFDTSTEGAVYATWENPVETPTAQAGYTAYVYADGVQTGEAFAVEKDLSQIDIADYIDETEEKSYVFALVSNAYIWDNEGTEILVLASEEVKLAEENALLSGLVPAMTVETTVTQVESNLVVTGYFDSDIYTAEEMANVKSVSLVLYNSDDEAVTEKITVESPDAEGIYTFAITENLIEDAVMTAGAYTVKAKVNSINNALNGDTTMADTMVAYEIAAMTMSDIVMDNKGIITWEDVDHAVSYTVLVEKAVTDGWESISGETGAVVSGTSYDISAEFVVAQAYKITITPNPSAYENGLYVGLAKVEQFQKLESISALSLGSDGNVLVTDENNSLAAVTYAVSSGKTGETYTALTASETSELIFIGNLDKDAQSLATYGASAYAVGFENTSEGITYLDSEVFSVDALSYGETTVYVGQIQASLTWPSAILVDEEDGESFYTVTIGLDTENISYSQMSKENYSLALTTDSTKILASSYETGVDGTIVAKFSSTAGITKDVAYVATLTLYPADGYESFSGESTWENSNTISFTEIPVDTLSADISSEGIMTWTHGAHISQYTVTVGAMTYQLPADESYELDLYKTFSLSAGLDYTIILGASPKLGYSVSDVSYGVYKLTAPTNVDFTLGDTLTATWDEVEKATAYTVTLGEVAETVSTNSFVITDLNYPENYVYSVMATGTDDNTTIVNSDAVTSGTFSTYVLAMGEISIDADTYTATFDAVANAGSYAITVSDTNNTVGEAVTYSTTDGIVTAVLDEAYFAQEGTVTVTVKAISGSVQYSDSAESTASHTIAYETLSIKDLVAKDVDGKIVLSFTGEAGVNYKLTDDKETTIVSYYKYDTATISTDDVTISAGTNLVLTASATAYHDGVAYVNTGKLVTPSVSYADKVFTIEAVENASDYAMTLYKNGSALDVTLSVDKTDETALKVDISDILAAAESGGVYKLSVTALGNDEVAGASSLDDVNTLWMDSDVGTCETTVLLALDAPEITSFTVDYYGNWTATVLSYDTVEVKFGLTSSMEIWEDTDTNETGNIHTYSGSVSAGGAYSLSVEALGDSDDFTSNSKIVHEELNLALVTVTVKVNGVTVDSSKYTVKDSSGVEVPAFGNTGNAFLLVMEEVYTLVYSTYYQPNFSPDKTGTTEFTYEINSTN